MARELSEGQTEQIDVTHGGLFIGFAFVLGIFCRRVLSATRVPYTVMLLLLGVFWGVLNRAGLLGSLGYSLDSWAGLDPHLFLYIFLPALIYEGTTNVDFHIFRTTSLQMLLLAGPGVVMASVMTACLAVAGFDYDWDWSTGMAFGAMLSATDPVAVVALLKELGASKKLAILIEGESLFNDGTAMVMFTLFKTMMTQADSAIGAGSGIVHFARLTIGGVLLGVCVGYAVTKIMVKIVDDALSEITLTMAACYGTYFIAEASPLQFSGVLAVVALGLFMSKVGKTSVSPDTEQFMHRFWDLTSYIANTLIFIVSGIVMVDKYDSSNIRPYDFLLLAVLYIGLHVARGLTIFLLSPALRKLGYGFSFNQGLILTWSGLRGAVGLALGLSVEIDKTIDSRTGALFMFYISGTAILTLLINGTTTGRLVRYLKMHKSSSVSGKIFHAAVHSIEHSIDDSVRQLKDDPFYAEADWETVWGYIPILSSEGLRKRLGSSLKRIPKEGSRKVLRYMENGYFTREDEEALKFSTNKSQKSLDLESGIYNITAVIEARHRFYNLLKSSYWHQFENGFAGSDAVTHLIEAANSAEDESLRTNGAVSINEWRYLHHICDIPPVVRRLFQIPYMGRILRYAVFRQVMIAFDVATSFLYAHKQVEEYYGELLDALTKELNLIDKEGSEAKSLVKAGQLVLNESKQSSCYAESLIDDLHKSFPEVAHAVVTRQATYAVLGTMKNEIKNLLEHGEIEEKARIDSLGIGRSSPDRIMEFQQLESALIFTRKKLVNHPPSLQVKNWEKVLRGVEFLSGLSHNEIRTVKAKSKEMLLNRGKFLFQSGDSANGCYVIIRGQVKVLFDAENSEEERVYDRACAGSVIGLLGFLTKSTYRVSAVCESIVEALLIDQHMMDFILSSSNPRFTEERLWQNAGMLASILYLEEFRTLRTTIVRQMMSRTCLRKVSQKEHFRVLQKSILMMGLARDTQGNTLETGKPILLQENTQEFIAETEVILLEIPESVADMRCPAHDRMMEAIKLQRHIIKVRKEADAPHNVLKYAKYGLSPRTLQALDLELCSRKASSAEASNTLTWPKLGVEDSGYCERSRSSSNIRQSPNNPKREF